MEKLRQKLRASDVSTYNLDREVTYHLDKVFNPFDLYNAVEKKTDRWVEFSDNPIDSTTFTTSHIPTLLVDARAISKHPSARLVPLKGRL